MKTACRQLRLILWKNFLTRKRQKIRLFFEILWPLLLFLLLMWVRTRGLRDNIDECHVGKKVLPSSGAVPFVQNWFCSLNNTCYSTVEEAQKKPENLNVTRLLQMAKEIQNVVSTQRNVESRLSQFSSFNLLEALVDSERLATLSKRLSSPDYKPALSPLRDFLVDSDTLPAELAANDIVLTKQELWALRNSTLSNLTFYYSPFSFLLADPFNIECNDLPAKLSDALRLANKRLCRLQPNETKLFVGTLNNHWNSSINKELVRDYVKNNLESEIAFFDWLAVNNIYKNLTNSSHALPQVQKVLRSEGGRSAGLDWKAIDRITKILNEYLCGKLSPNDESIFPDTEAKMEEFKEKYRLKQVSNYIYDNTTSEYCNNLFESMEANPLLRLLWRSYKHLVLGQILYTPVNPATDRVMKRVNDTYFQLEVYRELFEIIVDTAAPPAMRFLNRTANNLKTSREFLNTSSASKIFKLNDENSSMGILANLMHGEEILRSTLGAEDSSDDYEAFLDCFEYNKVRGVRDPQKAEKMAEELMEHNRLWALVVFESEMPDEAPRSRRTRRNTDEHKWKGKGQNSVFQGQSKRVLLKQLATSKNSSNLHIADDKLKPKVVYKIRMSPDLVDNTDFIKDRMERQGSRYRPMVDIKYITFGFVYLQDMIEKSIISEFSGTPMDELPGTVLQQYPHPCYIEDQFIKAVSRMFPLFMVLAWIFTCSMIVKSIVYEKELRLKQTMQVMGLRNWVYWMGWYIDSFLPMLLTISILTLILTHGKVLIYSDSIVIFVFLFLFTHCTIFFSFLISAFFSRANIAAACAGIIFFITYLPYPFMVRWILHFTPLTKSLVCLLSNVALGLGASYIAEFEEQGVGVNWNNLSVSPVYDDDFNIIIIMMIMVIDCLLYALLTWYIEGAFPGQYGVPLPWYFPFTASYWRGTPAPKGSKNVIENSKSSAPISNGEAESRLASSSGDGLEPDPPNLYPGVEIQNLTKIYSNGKVAVNNLSMNFYEDQITSFLGHNGAGKTTTISILTGLYPPSSGTAIICGYDIRTDITKVRKNLGICPQHNVLFHRLTVLEHLKFYGFLRGSNEKLVEAEFEQMLLDLDLPDKRKAFPNDLSGGMQRKLSIALAFIGGSKVVILDEPTSGVDPYSRRSIWELLLKYKKGRTVILTTHYMDEADLLGDRIGIISKGSIKCCGSSLFLKAKYGLGYTLTVELKPESSMSNGSLDKSTASLHSSPSEDSLAITKTVKQYVPDATVQSRFGNEITFILPSKNSKMLENLCARLDDDLSRLNALSYGISDSSLEEIFLRITDDSPDEPETLKSKTHLFRDALIKRRTHDMKGVISKSRRTPTFSQLGQLRNMKLN